MLSGIIDRALSPGEIFSEDEFHRRVMEVAGIDREGAGRVRLNMMMRGELVLEPGNSDEDARFRRVKVLGR